jgi:hypothetical protein
METSRTYGYVTGTSLEECFEQLAHTDDVVSVVYADGLFYVIFVDEAGAVPFVACA